MITNPTTPNPVKTWLRLVSGLLILLLAGTRSAYGVDILEQTSTINRFNLPAGASVAVSAYIGGFLFDLEGLTSPWAKVDFYSTEGNIDVHTMANEEGIFYFNSILAPLQTGDFCFLSYDTDQTANNPLCFPAPMPQTKTVIKGIILSPSLSISQGIFKQNEMVQANGRTFPNAQIEVYLFEEERSWWREIIDVVVPVAFARQGPGLEITADNKGDFAFNLPTQKSSQWRFFVGPKLENENMVSKSNTLEFTALSWWQWFLLQLFTKINQLLKWLFRTLLDWKTVILLLSVSIAFIASRLLRRRPPPKPLPPVCDHPRRLTNNVDLVDK
ncbi:MAG: hypothetical protein ABID04_00865 [Patescibacteria group bacterium]